MTANPDKKGDNGQDLAAVAIEAREFADHFSSVLLGVAAEGCRTVLGYAPCVRDAQMNYYLLVSDLAEHTAPLLQQGQASMLWIEEEAQARNPFARRRLTLQSRVVEIGRESPLFEQRVAQLEQRFGDTVRLLKGLADFRLLQLVPDQGRYVVGFGRAYRIDSEQGRWRASGPLRPTGNDQ